MATKFDLDIVLGIPLAYDVSNMLCYLVLEFAVLDYLDTARHLVSLLNVRNPCYHHYETYFQPLWFAWEITS